MACGGGAQVMAQDCAPTIEMDVGTYHAVVKSSKMYIFVLLSLNTEFF